MAILCALDSVRRRFRLGNLPVLMYGYSAGGQCAALFSAFMKGEVAAWGAHGCGVYPVALTVLLLPFVPKTDVPVIQDGFVVRKGECMPFVFRDGAWPLRSVLPYLNGGYRISILPGCVDVPENVESVILFGAVAESAFRFPKAEITVVDPPEFCTLPPNAGIMSRTKRKL